MLRSTLHEGYADASDDEMEDALANVLDSLSPAEAFNFGSALNQIGKSASRVVSDPTFVSVAQTALPVLGIVTCVLLLWYAAAIYLNAPGAIERVLSPRGGAKLVSDVHIIMRAGRPRLIPIGLKRRKGRRPPHKA